MTLKRALNPMPDEVLQALLTRNLLTAFRGPAAFFNATTISAGSHGRGRKKPAPSAFAQMLDELEDGDIYMKMRWSPPR